jgi:hypothetical protein
MMKAARFFAYALAVVMLVASPCRAEMTTGNPEFQSMSELAFGPDGILFVADAKAAAIVALQTGDTQPGDAKAFSIVGIDQKIAALLGTAADQIIIGDLAVNPISHNAYMSVSRGRGPDATPALLKIDQGQNITEVAMDGATFSKAVLPNAVAGGEDRRGRNPRMESITDITFLDGRLIVAGLSNEEFASNLRTIPYPFQTVENGTAVEIYHGAHGKFETRAPIRTLVPFNIGPDPHVLAAYTCTPLVQFPVKALEPGAKIRGKTVAELGNRNRPLDMVVYEQSGKEYLLIANSSRGVMKVDTANIETIGSIESQISDTAGLGYQTIESWKGVNQLDLVGRELAMVVRDTGNGSLNLESLQLP